MKNFIIACLSIVITINFLVIVVNANTCPDKGDGWETRTLNTAIDYKVHYKVVGSVLHLQLNATSPSSGGRWLGFGFAEQNSGHMKGSDIVTATIENGVVKVDDRYADFAPSGYTEQGGEQFSGLTAAIDTYQDWTVVSGIIRNGRMEIYLTRPLDTNDKQDRPILAGSRRVIWSYGGGYTVGYHGANRGATMITFIAGGTQRNFPSYDGSWKRRFSNYTVPKQTTTYACQSFEFPTTGSDKHIVAIRGIFKPGNEAYPHHAILHVCQQNEYWQNHSIPDTCSKHFNGNSQGSSPLGEATSQCSSLMWSWAVGLGDFILPQEAGFRVGSGNAKISHVILEIHYDNPHQHTVVDSTGFEAFYVNTPRANDAAGMTLGDPLVQMSSLPINQDLIHRQATCPSACTQDLNQTITVFSGLLHMHHFGRKMYTDLYNSTGHYAKTTNRIDYWDNSFQQMRDDDDFKFQIKPGDSLQTHCYYNTKGRATGSAIPFGPATGDEMCMDFLFYYPAQYRNTDTNGQSQLFAFCGFMDNGGQAQTVCGGLSQENNAYVITSGQVAQNSGGFSDPYNFTSSNKGNGGEAKTTNVCTMPITTTSAPVSTTAAATIATATTAVTTVAPVSNTTVSTTAAATTAAATTAVTTAAPVSNTTIDDMLSTSGDGKKYQSGMFFLLLVLNLLLSLC